MSVTAEPVRYSFADYVRYSETYPDGTFELIDGVIFKLPPEGDDHLVTRSGIFLLFAELLDLTRYAPYSEASFPAHGWADGPRPDLFVARGPAHVGGKFPKRPTARDITLVIEVSSSLRRKDKRKAGVYARLGIPEYWLIDLLAGVVVDYREPTREADIATYQYARDFERGEKLTSTSVDALSIETNVLLQMAD